ncbi:MAG TPA: iron-sulfur cluster co-chaperone HscB C-terminal domain-containing protein [Planctomycetota bacterium]|nr:iron-sulfur cluster co-chaperone HscB C-terminal domain-containing protein [Planctomycetota bacterium]
MTRSASTSVCPRCKATLETPLACSACGALISGAVGADQDPFAIFGMEIAYAVDRATLEKRLLRFTRLVHPDFFATADKDERAKAEAASAALNAAHEILAHDWSRADWIVRHQGGPDEQSERAMPQAFLMEVLDWNETLESARAAPPGSIERAAVEQLAGELDRRRAGLLQSIAKKLASLPPAKSPLLAEIRKELNAARYVDKTLDEIALLRVTQSLSR